MSSYGDTKKSLAKHGLAPKKRFGQNFLVHQHTAVAIVRAGNIQPTDTVVEVGVGLGALTRPLANAAHRVIGLEVDSGIIRYHQDNNDLPDNVTLIHMDVLKASMKQLAEQCGGPLKILANLPYSISNPFIFKLIDNRECVDSVTVMLQKEVAERLMASPSTKEYGVPSVLLQSCASIKPVMTLKPSEFHPRPKIDSLVIRIEFDHSPRCSLDGQRYSYPLFKRIVRSSFNKRRKTILNTLSSESFFLESSACDNKIDNKHLTQQAILNAGLSPSVRPETLKVAEFIQLAISFEAQTRQSNNVTQHCRPS